MKMYRYSLKNSDVVFQAEDQESGDVFGFCQEWYPTPLQRIAGCGPTVACAIMTYILWHCRNENSPVSEGRPACLSAMEEAWRHVTPGDEGIPTTRMFCEGFLEYAKAKELDVDARSLDVPQEMAFRPSFAEILRFISDALAEDVPVAFLNLCNGDVHNLDRWHWVTILSIEYDGHNAVVRIMDEGRLLDVDLRLWYDTTVGGGGFACFLLAEKGAAV
ncbi:MAG: hypothetical protein QM215_07825 [Bacillota bacterium]|jgi:hypothetical protein|nr:hypothetical protein [Bacillota bacterium]